MLNNYVSIHPYFKVSSGKMDEFKLISNKLENKVKSEVGCLYYEFTFNDDVAYCREGYKSAQDLLDHQENVGLLIDEALKISELIRFELHGPVEELDKLKTKLSNLNPQYFER